MIIDTGIEMTTSSNEVLQIIYQIAQILGTVLIAAYVIYTGMTFKQIKRQTDYQQDAYLRIDPKIIKEAITNRPPNSIYKIGTKQFISPSGEYYTKYIQRDLQEKFKGTLQPIFKFDDSVFEGNYYTLIFTNYGNAEVVKIVLNLNIEVRNAKPVSDSKVLKEAESQAIKLQIEELVGRSGDSIKVPILPTAAFPIFKISTKGEYYDIRNKKYIIPTIITEGLNEHFHQIPSYQTQS